MWKNTPSSVEIGPKDVISNRPTTTNKKVKIFSSFDTFSVTLNYIEQLEKFILIKLAYSVQEIQERTRSPAPIHKR